VKWGHKRRHRRFLEAKLIILTAYKQEAWPAVQCHMRKQRPVERQRCKPRRKG
jgi:hypothetical protein